MKRFTHPSGSVTRPVHSEAMLQLLGVKKLPVGGMPPREIQGIRVWVTPSVPKFRKGWNGREYVEMRVKSSAHRVRCACPDCGAEVSAGRLFQHRCPPRQPEKVEHCAKHQHYVALCDDCNVLS